MLGRLLVDVCLGLDTMSVSNLKKSQGWCAHIVLVLVQLVVNHVLGGRGTGTKAGIGIFRNFCECC